MQKVIGNIENRVKIYIQQGSDFAVIFDLSNFSSSLVDATGRGQIRARASDTGDPVANFTCVVDSNAKTMTVSLPAADSSAITLNESTDARRTNTLFAYDIELVFAGGTVTRLMWGEAEIIPEVTK